MKCPKCKYVSHDYLDSCRKCGADLVAFKRDMGLFVRQPGVLDLSLVLGEAGADDLFASMEEEVTLSASHDDAFAMRLDDDADHRKAWRATGWVPQAGGQETTGAMPGLDHLALELDTAARSAELAASLPAAPGLPDAQSHPPTPAVPPPVVSGESRRPGHVTLEMESDSMPVELPSAALAELAALSPPPVPETVATPGEKSAMAESVTEEQAESIDKGARGAEGRAEPPEVGEPINTTSAIFELSADDLLLASQADEPSGSDLAAVVESARHGVDAPGSQEASRWPVLELAPDVSASAVEPTLPDPAMPGLDDAALGDDLAASTLPGDLSIELSPPDMGPEQDFTTPEALALEDLEALSLPGHLTLDLEAAEIMANWSAATLDEVRLDDPPGDVQSPMSPPQNQAGDEEELLLDLDDGAFDGDAPA